jgi:hypothetical protein
VTARTSESGVRLELPLSCLLSRVNLSTNIFCVIVSLRIDTMDYLCAKVQRTQDRVRIGLRPCMETLCIVHYVAHDRSYRFYRISNLELFLSKFLWTGEIKELAVETRMYLRR